MTGLKGLLRYSAMVLILVFVLAMAGCGTDVGEELLDGAWWGDPQLDGDHFMYIKFGPTRETKSIVIGNVSSYEVEVAYFYDVTDPLNIGAYTWKVLLPGLTESVVPLEIEESSDTRVSKPLVELCTLTSILNKHTFKINDPGKDGVPYLVMKGEYNENNGTFILDVYVGENESYTGVTFKPMILE